MKGKMKYSIMYKLISVVILLFLTLSGYSQLTQSIKGTVIDEASQTPLQGASVVILNTEPAKGTITDRDGNFVITGVPIGRNHLHISYLGYEPYDISSLMLTSGKEVVLTIELKEYIEKIDEVIIFNNKKDKTINSMTMISARTFSVEETRRYAGGLDDPGRLASVFAGVADGSIESNGIVVRGNAPSGIIYKVEGVEVDNPNHFAGEDFLGGGFVSILNNHVLGDSDFLTGAFPAEYGNALSGVFDIHLRTGNSDKREHAVQIGVLGLDFSSEGPFVNGKKPSYLFNYRYSTFGLVKTFLPSTEGIPVYQDLCFKINIPAGMRILSIWGAGGLDNYTYGNLSNNTYKHGRIYINDDSGTGFLGIRYRHFINQTTFSSLTLLANASIKSNNLKEQHTDYEYYTRERIEDLTGKYVLSAFINKKYGVRHTNRTGFNYSWLFYDMNNKVTDEIPQLPVQFINSDGNTGLIQVYSQSKIGMSERLTFNTGINFQYFTLNDEYSIEPRVGLNIKINTKNTISLAYGKQSQIQPICVYYIEREENGSITYPNQDIGFALSHHIILGYDRSLNENMRLKIEPFYQYLTHVPVIPYTSFSIINLLDLNTFNEVLVSDGYARNIGIDFTLERFFNQGFYYLGTISLFDSRYKGGDGIWRNTRYNKNFVANILGGKEWKVRDNNFLGVNGRIYLKDGDRTSPFDQDESAFVGEVVYDKDLVFDKKNPFTYRCDISTTYTINKVNYSSRFALQIMNIFYSVVSFEDRFNDETQRAETKEGKMLLPSVSWKIEF